MNISGFRRSANIEDDRGQTGGIDPLGYFFGNTRAPFTLGVQPTPTPVNGPTQAASFGLSMPQDSFVPYASSAGDGSNAMSRYLAQLLMRNSDQSPLLGQ